MNNLWIDLCSWYGLGYLTSFVVGFVFLVVAMMGLGGDKDINADTPDEMAFGKDVPLENGNSFLSFLGIGHAPIAVVFMLVCFIFFFLGATGLVFLRNFTDSELLLGVLGYPISSFVSLFLAGRAAKVFGKFFPSVETYPTTEADHVGMVGQAVYRFVGGSGFIQVQAQDGTVYQLPAVTSSLSELINSGDQILVIRYNEEEKTFLVEKAPNLNEKDLV